MSRKSSHYIRPKSNKPLFSKTDIKWMIGIAIVIAVIVAAIIVYAQLTDETLRMKNGKVVGAEENWIIANSGKSNTPSYMKYAEYDFSGYAGEVVSGGVSFDENATCVELFPEDDRYVSAYIYASGKDTDTVVRNVTGQIGAVLTEGSVYPAEEFNGGYIFWYTAREDRVIDEETEEKESVYIQVFTAYLPADNEGTLIVRVNYEFDSPESFVDAEIGYAETEALLNGLSY